MPELEGVYQTMQKRGADVKSIPRQDEYANAMISQSLPPLVDLVVNNKVFGASTGTATAIANIFADPTTVSAVTLYNPSTTLSLLIIKAWMHARSGARAIGGSLWVCVSMAEESTAPAEDALGIKGVFGTKGAAVAVLDTTITFGTAPLWIPIEAKDTIADTQNSPAFLLNDLYGRFIVPPRGIFALQMYNSAAGAGPSLYGGGVVWAETVLTPA